MPDLPRGNCTHVPSIFEDAWLDTVDLTAGKAVQQAVKAVQMLTVSEVSSVLLTGRPGCGKSHLAAAACNEIAAPLWDRYRTVQTAYRDHLTASGGIVTGDGFRLREAEQKAWKTLECVCPRWLGVPAFLGRLKREMSRPVKTAEVEMDELLQDPGELLVLDDLGAERSSEWSTSLLFELVDACYSEHQRLLVTSNLSARELAAAGYDRVVSRLADGGVLLEMTSAKDYRQRNRRSVA